MPNLPMPTQQGPRPPHPAPFPGVPTNPYGGWPGSILVNPFTKEYSDKLAAERAALEQSYNQNFNQPVAPGTPGGAAFYDLQKLVGGLAAVPYGAGALSVDLKKGFVDAGRGIGDYFTGTDFVDPRSMPGIQESGVLPGVAEFLKAQKEAANPGGASLGSPLSPLDGLVTIPGQALPTPPKRGLPPDFKPDLSKADARLEAGRPKSQEVKGDKLSSFLEGASMASAQIDPFETAWPQALAAIVSGGVQGQRDLRLRQEESELKQEADLRQYELMRAGIDEQRAANEAQMQYNRTRLELDAHQQNFENSWKMAQASEPKIIPGEFGALTIITRNPEGGFTHQTIGHDEALQRQIMLANAKALGGKSAEVQMEQQILKDAGPFAAMDLKLGWFIDGGSEAALLGPGTPAYEKYINDIAAFEKQLALENLSPFAYKERARAEKRSRFWQLLMSNPQVQQHALPSLGFKVAPAPAPQVK